MKTNNTCTLILLAGVIVYIVTAVNSHGYYHADEHYQIIEFAGLKTGDNDAGDLPWEFRLQLRPALQPTLCYVVFSIAGYFGISDPYSKATVLRILTALLAVFAIYFFAKTAIRSYGIPHGSLFLAVSLLLWFLPYINVRFSSETWSGLFFLTGLTFILRYQELREKKWMLAGGLLLGLSFLFRYQAAIQVFFLTAWLLAVKKESLSAVIRLASAFAAAVATGIAIDTWFYGNLTFTAWNYFRVNILENATAGFGVSPWYQYVADIIQFPGYPFGIIILLSFVILIIRKPLSLFTWITVPFIVFHSLIGHKEIRFLFPLVNLVPVMVFLAWQGTALPVLKKRWQQGMIYLSLVLLILLNFTGLSAMMSKPGGTGRMGITRFIERNYGSSEKMLLYTSYSNPYNPWHSLPEKFYQDEYMDEVRIKSLCSLDTLPLPQDQIVLLAARYPDLTGRGCSGLPEDRGFTLVKRSVPRWIEWLNRYYGALDPDDIIFLYEKER